MGNAYQPPGLGQPYRSILYKNEEDLDVLISTRMVNLSEEMDGQKRMVVDTKALLRHLREIDGMEPSAFDIFRNLIFQLENLEKHSPEQLKLWNRIKEQIECSGNTYFRHVPILYSLQKKCNEIAKEQGDEFQDLLQEFNSINTQRIWDNYYENATTQEGDYAHMLRPHDVAAKINMENDGVSYVVLGYPWLPPFEQESDVGKIISTWRSGRDCYLTRMLPDESPYNCAVLPKEFRLEGLLDMKINERKWYKNFKSIFENFMGFIRF